MKKYFAAAFVTLLAGFTLAATASADVPRYQTQTGTLTVTLAAPYGYVHVFNIALNPCDNSFTGSGSSAGNVATETISGTLVDGILSFTAVYDNGYSWTYSGPLTGGTASDSSGRQAAAG